MKHILGIICTLPLSLVATGLLLACGGANEGAPVPGTAAAAVERPAGATNVQKGADAAVVNKLAMARCEQEQTCKNVGAGAKFASHDVCMDQMRGSLANDLNAYDCPRGLDREALDRCTAAIKSEECGHPLDTLTRIDKCRTGALCMK